MRNEELIGAIARGWCHPTTENKEMDVALGEAIALEVEPLLAKLAAERDDALDALEAVTRERDGERARWERPAARWRKMRKAVLEEKVDAAATGEESDLAYNQAIDDAVRAIDRIAGSDAEEKPTPVVQPTDSKTDADESAAGEEL